MLGRCLRYVWAFPVTAVGLLFVPAACLTGGGVRVIRGAVEVHGGLAARFIRSGLAAFGPVAAITLGHVILGLDRACLDRAREHEHVHVRQYERWGVFLPPAYLLTSLVLYVRGRDPYGDNPFEREAYAGDGQADSGVPE